MKVKTKLKAVMPPELRVRVGNRNKQLRIKVLELQAQLKAAGGETRKNMRERLARTTGELAEVKKEVGNLTHMNENLLVQMVAHGYNREKTVWLVKEEEMKS